MAEDNNPYNGYGEGNNFDNKSSGHNNSNSRDYNGNNNNSGGGYNGGNNNRGGGGNTNSGGNSGGYNNGGGGGNSGGYNRNNSNSNSGGGNSGGYQKKKWVKKKFPASKVYLPVTFLFEKTTTPDDIGNVLPEVVRFCQDNGYIIRVMGPDDINQMVKQLAPDTIICNHWDGFGETACDVFPTKFEEFLARHIWPWLENQKEAMSKFIGTNISALVGNAHYGRAYAMVTFTEDGINDPQKQSQRFKFMNTPLETANIYRIPIINLARNSHMDDLQATLRNSNPFQPPQNNNRG